MREAVFAVVRARPFLGVTDLEFCVLLSLAEHLNGTTSRCDPSPETIACDCGRDPHTAEAGIRKAVKALERKRLVWAGENEAGGRWKRRRYVLHPQLDPTQKGVAGAPFEDWRPPCPPVEKGGRQSRKGGRQSRERGSLGPPNLGSRTGEENHPTSSRSRVDAAPRRATALLDRFLVRAVIREDSSATHERPGQKGEHVRTGGGQVLASTSELRSWLVENAEHGWHEEGYR